MAGTLSKKPIPGVCDYCGKFGHRCSCMGSPAPVAPSELPAPKVVVWYRSASEIEVMQKRARAMWAAAILAKQAADEEAARARTWHERQASLPTAPLTMSERVSAFEAGGSLITNEKFEFSRPRCRDLRPHGMVKTPIPRIDPSDFE